MVSILLGVQPARQPSLSIGFASADSTNRRSKIPFSTGSPWMWRADRMPCSLPFYMRDLSSCGLRDLQGSWNQSLQVLKDNCTSCEAGSAPDSSFTVQVSQSPAGFPPRCFSKLPPPALLPRCLHWAHILLFPCSRQPTATPIHAATRVQDPFSPLA